MPDWSYRTVLRPLMRAAGSERSRRGAVATLRALSRLPLGLGGAFIDFLGHMRADKRLRTTLAGIQLQSPGVLAASIDPDGDALPSFARFGAGLIEVGPVTSDSVERVRANLQRKPEWIAVCAHIGEREPDSVRRVAGRLTGLADCFSVDALDSVPAAAEHGPVFVRIDGTFTGDALPSAATGLWLQGSPSDAEIRSLRARLPEFVPLVAGDVQQPQDARLLLDAGANAFVIGSGLLASGPGLMKRCNEALLSTIASPVEPEPLSLDAARRAWFWALFLGVAMFGGGLLAMVIASTRVVLPYDETLCGLTRAQMISLNPRLLPFMAHDRVSLAGTMLSIGIFYASLGWFGIRRGAHWAHVTVIASAGTGFLTFFYFLGFGYFDPFHAFVTAILTQFTLLCLITQQSPAAPPLPEWRETAAWRRGQWGQLLFVLIGVTLTAAGVVISYIGCTSVFVDTDLEFMRTTAARLRLSYERLVPLVAHDRASLGGMLIANGITIWLAAQWGFRAGARWLWLAFAWGGNIAFASATAVHFAVGYGSLLHLTPAFAGWAAWNVALLLTREWLGETSHHRDTEITEPSVSSVSVS